MKDKNHRITLRLNEEQFNFVRENAEILDCSPSDFLRMVINSTLVASLRASKKVEEVAKAFAKSEEEVKGRENDITNQHNLV